MGLLDIMILILLNILNGENPLEMRAYTISQLKRIHDLFTFLVYDVHGFIPDDKIRVIFYYGQE